MIKLFSVLSVNDFHFLFIQINLCAVTFPQYSRSSKILAFIVLILAIFFQTIGLLALILVKVYQISFVGEYANPLDWPVTY